MLILNCFKWERVRAQNFWRGPRMFPHREKRAQFVPALGQVLIIANGTIMHKFKKIYIENIKNG